MDTLFSLIFVYSFIFLGYLAKRIFKEEMDSRTLTIFSVYFLQPFVSAWGFSSSSLALEHAFVSFYYFIIIALVLLPTIFIAKTVFEDPKEQAIFSIAGLVGNTGNIGIPLGIALFGHSSVIYTTLINIANVFVVYILGVYIYSRGSFSIQKSLLNIIKIPIIPVSMVAIILNLNSIEIPSQIEEFLKMGAYGGIVLQLFLLGTFLYGLEMKRLRFSLLIGTLSQKFIFVPLVSALMLSFSDLSLFVQGIILMEMMTPLAIANINLASLYDCRPQETATLILLSTLIFIPVIFLLVKIIHYHYF
jgi:predicted permease